MYSLCVGDPSAVDEQEGGAGKCDLCQDSPFMRRISQPYYMAPEIITQEGAGRLSDVWSVGCTVIEMATGLPPWTKFGDQVGFFCVFLHPAPNQNSFPLLLIVSPGDSLYVLCFFSRVMCQIFLQVGVCGACELVVGAKISVLPAGWIRH